MKKIDYVVYNSGMEFANVEIEEAIGKVRIAESADAKAITRLLRQVPYSHLHADWRLPVDWLGSAGFVVLPESEYETQQRRSVAARLLPKTIRLRGCLAVAADPPPVAWVRVASITPGEAPDVALAALLLKVKDYLRCSGVSELAWLAIREWPNAWLPELGFSLANQIETYVKEDKWLPRITAVPNLNIRPVESEDMNILEELEAAAFVAKWRYSAETMRLARQQALCFTVAVLDYQIVGFQISSRAGNGAHLVRLTVHPDFHQQGIGSALLTDAFQIYRRYDLKYISLNTQEDNHASKYLYQKFGFQASGQLFPVWVLPL